MSPRPTVKSLTGWSVGSSPLCRPTIQFQPVKPVSIEDMGAAIAAQVLQRDDWPG